MGHLVCDLSNEQSQKFEGKPKHFKNWPICAKHAIFAIESSHMQVAKHLSDKNFENFSKCFSQLKVPLARKSRREQWKFLCNLTTGAFTHKQVTNLSHEKLKNPDFEKFAKYFSQLGLWLANESRIFSKWCSWLRHATGLTRDQVARTGQHCFWNFWHFCKYKILSKNN